MNLLERRSENEFITYKAHPAYSTPELLKLLRAVGGLDIGKAVHPSHLAILLAANLGAAKQWIQIASVWMPLRMPYTRQVEYVKSLMLELGCKQIAYDATRGELEALAEQGLLLGFKPVKLSAKSKKRLAGRLLTALEQGKLKLLPDERQKRSLLQVDNALKADESEDGHGDAMWSLALALEAADCHHSSIPGLLARGGK